MEPHHQEVFDNIKQLTKIDINSINRYNLDSVITITDTSNREAWGYYGQGQDCKTMRPAVFRSLALNLAEKNYPTLNEKRLAVIDCLKKWEPQLSGVRFDILTDNVPRHIGRHKESCTIGRYDGIRLFRDLISNSSHPRHFKFRSWYLISRSLDQVPTPVS